MNFEAQTSTGCLEQRRQHHSCESNSQEPTIDQAGVLTCQTLASFSVARTARLGGYVRDEFGGRATDPDRGGDCFSMKRRHVKPLGKRSPAGPLRSAEQLPDLVEDPLPKKPNMKAEQQAAFKKPADPDRRTRASESDQGRTR
jgi:hypothetical protein